MNPPIRTIAHPEPEPDPDAPAPFDLTWFARAMLLEHVERKPIADHIRFHNRLLRGDADAVAIARACAEYERVRPAMLEAERRARAAQKAADQTHYRVIQSAQTYVPKGEKAVTIVHLEIIRDLYTELTERDMQILRLEDELRLTRAELDRERASGKLPARVQVIRAGSKIEQATGQS